MKEILNNKYIIPLFITLIGVVGYSLNVQAEIASIMLVIGILGLMANCNEWSNPNPKTINLIVLLSTVAFINPVLGLIYFGFAIYVLTCALASRPLTA